MDAVGKETNTDPPDSMHHCSCSMHESINPGTGSIHSVTTQDATNMSRSSSNGRGPSSDLPSPGQPPGLKRTQTNDKGYRRRVAVLLTTANNYFGTVSPSRFDDSDFKHGEALNFPVVPGEEHRNPKLRQINEQYNPDRDTAGNVTPIPRGRPSRAASFASSHASGHVVGGGSSTSRATSPSPSPSRSRRPHAGTPAVRHNSFELQNPLPSSSAGSTGGSLHRRDTLEVPSQAHYGHTRNNISASSAPPIVAITRGQNSPAIVVSSDHETSSPTHGPVSNPPSPALSSDAPSIQPPATSHSSSSHKRQPTP
jgi:hypothetical protein